MNRKRKVNRMNRNERNRYVEQHLKDYLPKEFQQAEVKVLEICKNNGEIKDGVVVRENTEGAVPILYLDEYNFLYPDKVLKEIAENYLDILARDQDMVNKIKEELKERESILNKVTLHAINRERNTAFLANIPHLRLQDLALYPVIDLGNSMICNVTYDFCSYIKISGDEMLKIALHNLSVQKAIIVPVSEMLRDIGFPMDEELENKNPMKMYVVTNQNALFGAAHIMNPNVMERLQKIFQDGFYILPSSTHELIVIDSEESEQSVSDLVRIVKEVNKNEVVYDEQLSNHVYRFKDKETGLEMYEDGKWYKNSIHTPMREIFPQK